MPTREDAEATRSLLAYDPEAVNPADDEVAQLDAIRARTALDAANEQLDAIRRIVLGHPAVTGDEAFANTIASGSQYAMVNRLIERLTEQLDAARQVIAEHAPAVTHYPSLAVQISAALEAADQAARADVAARVRRATEEVLIVGDDDDPVARLIATVRDLSQQMPTTTVNSTGAAVWPPHDRDAVRTLRRVLDFRGVRLSRSDAEFILEALTAL